MEHNKKEPDDDVHSMDVTPVYDPGTLIMLTSLLMAVMGIVLLLMGRASTPAIAGYRHWAAGSLLAMFSGLLGKFTAPMQEKALLLRWPKFLKLQLELWVSDFAE